MPCDQLVDAPCMSDQLDWLVAPAVVFAVRVDAVAEEPFTAGAMQILEVGSRHDHTMQQFLELIIRLVLHVGDLPTIPKALRRAHQKRPQRGHVAAAQDAAKLGDIGRLASLHMGGDPERTRTSCLQFRKLTLYPG